MSKFTRVVRFKNNFHTISHANGQTYTEDHEGTGLFEAPHAHADEFVKSGFAEDYAGTMEEALEKLNGPRVPEKKVEPVQTPRRKL